MGSCRIQLDIRPSLNLSIFSLFSPCCVVIRKKLTCPCQAIVCSVLPSCSAAWPLGNSFASLITATPINHISSCPPTQPVSTAWLTRHQLPELVLALWATVEAGRAWRPWAGGPGELGPGSRSRLSPLQPQRHQGGVELGDSDTSTQRWGNSALLLARSFAV